MSTKLLAAHFASETLERSEDRTTQLWMLAVLGCLIVALVVRVLALRSLSGTPYFTSLIGDEQQYHKWAAALAAGKDLPLSSYPLSPLPVYLMAVVYKLFGPDPLYIRILNIELSTALCGLMYLIGSQLGNRAVGLGAALLGAFYKPFIFYSIVPLKTTLVVFLFGLSLYLFLCAMNTPSWTKLALLGAAMACLTTARENALALVPFAAALLLWNGIKENCRPRAIAANLCIFIGSTLLVLSPFVARNYLVAGEVTLTTHQAGLNLYLGNRLENPLPYYRPVPFASSNPSVQEIQFWIEASRRVGAPLSSGEAERYWIKEVGELAFAHPWEILHKQFNKLLALFNQYEAGDHYDIDFMGQFAPFFSLPLAGAGVVIAFGMPGMILHTGRSRLHMAVGVFFIVYALSVIPFHINGRYRLPLFVILIPFALLGIQQALHWARSRQLKPLSGYALCFAFSVGIANVPIAVSNDLSGYYNVHALVLSQKGKPDEARTYWKMSSESQGSFADYASLSLAEEAILGHDYVQASLLLNRVPDESFAASSKYELLGDYWMQQNRAEEAILAYDRAIAINSGKVLPRQKLLAALAMTRSPRISQEQAELRHIASYYPVLPSKEFQP